MSTPLSVRIDRAADGQLVLFATGEIDASNVADFTNALNAGTDGDADTLTVDLSAVEYLDSAAINALAPHAESLQIIANPVLMRVLTVSGLAELAKIRPASVTNT
jgi:anti-anti-sigma factor